MKVSDIQRKCPYCASLQVKQKLYDRIWKSASNEIDHQIEKMEANIEELKNYQRFLKGIKE